MMLVGKGSAGVPTPGERSLTMTEMLPLFPLGTVLFPGLPLPLHIFEPRYRQLVRDLLDGPQPGRFGVIAIRQGRETGVAGVSALYEIGCTATLRRVTKYDDGRFDLFTVGTQRFRLTGLDDSRPYLQAEVELLGESAGDEAAAAQAAGTVQRAFGMYLEALRQREGTEGDTPELPDDPILLSYLVAASMILDLAVRQALLAEPDAAHRLGSERALLAREITMLRSLTATPAPELRNSPYSPN
jgi:Lon protease-like protein